MKFRVVREPIPRALPVGHCSHCGRRRIPYLPACLCGKPFLDVPDSDPLAQPSASLEAPAAPERTSIPLAKPANTFRIAHWSDLHLGSRSPDGQRAEVRMRSLLSSLNELSVDALVISGDLTRFGTLEELSRARDLLAAYGFSGSRLVVVPGNHDVPRGQDSSNFQRVFEVSFPHVVELCPGLLVFALDSNRLEDRTLFERRWVPVRGRVGREVLDALEGAWRRPVTGSRLLVLHHHLARLSPESRWFPFDERTFKADQRLMAPLLDSEEVQAFAQSMHMTAALHGHKHWYSRTGYRVGSLPLFNAGSLTRMDRPQFRLFDFRSTPLQTPSNQAPSTQTPDQKTGEWTGLSRVEATL